MKKLSALLIATILSLSLFTACVAQKPDKTISNTPPQASGTKQETKRIDTEETKAELITHKGVPTKESSALKETIAETTVPPTEKIKERKAEHRTEHKKEKTTLHTTQQTKPSRVTEVSIIAADKVKETVLTHAQLNVSEVKYYHAELDRERRTLVYEIEFASDRYEYDYEVNAETGKIIKAEKEFRD